jgi:signal transduction histidine kinase
MPWRSLAPIIVSWKEGPVRRGSKPAKTEAKAKQAVSRKSSQNDGPRLRHLEKRLAEVQEQQKATSEILRVISGSATTHLQPVLDAVARNAAHLCGATDAQIFRVDGEVLRRVASHGTMPAWERIPIDRQSVTGRALVDRRTIHVRDIEAEPDTDLAVGKSGQREIGFRTVLATPLLREGTALGAILIRRMEVSSFSDSQIRLLETFADQAVIAIENVRLFQELEVRNRELTEALEQQTATAEILRAISSSPTDTLPVFETIAENAVRICDARQCTVFRFDGTLIRLVDQHHLSPEALHEFQRAYPLALDADTMAARVIRGRAIVNSPDLLNDPEASELVRRMARAGGYRSLIGVPMLRSGAPIGVIGVTRSAADGGPRPFSDKETALLQTFADQGVIAVENVRLFRELEARTRELGRSVEELQALSEVGRAVSSTLDLDTVLQTIVTRASQLAGTDACSVYEYDEATEAFHLRATHNLDEEVVSLARRTPTHKGEGVQGRMAVTRQPIQIPDIAAEDAYRGSLRDILLRTGTRALLAVPMLREDELIGGLTVNKKTPGAFAPELIELLQTFATQSALAIQNARLFRELEAKSRLLEAASRHKSEFLANMSHELRTPLNAILGFSEVLAERMFGEVNEKQAEYLQDILSSGRHLLSLINDILDLSKVEAGRLELELGRFHLPTALDNALTLVRERATRHGITLTQTVDERVGHIVADERKVKQILLNLLSNAVKFTPEGGRVDLRATATDDGITIAVSDTGIGIEPEDQAAIFEEFRQVGRDDARKQEGTGLGLTLAKKFVELHGGRIWVESQLGQGSTFTFRLPVRPGGMDSSNRELAPH